MIQPDPSWIKHVKSGPGFLVIRKTDKGEYVVHLAVPSVPGFDYHRGDYCLTLRQAEECLYQRSGDRLISAILN